VRQRGQQRLPVAIRQGDQRVAQIERRLDQREDELPLKQPVHRHVDVVAAARGV
jgi:hypothetical protein